MRHRSNSRVSAIGIGIFRASTNDREELANVIRKRNWRVSSRSWNIPLPCIATCLNLHAHLGPRHHVLLGKHNPINHCRSERDACLSQHHGRPHHVPHIAIDRTLEVTVEPQDGKSQVRAVSLVGEFAVTRQRAVGQLNARLGINDGVDERVAAFVVGKRLRLAPPNAAVRRTGRQDGLAEQVGPRRFPVDLGSRVVLGVGRVCVRVRQVKNDAARDRARHVTCGIKSERLHPPMGHNRAIVLLGHRVAHNGERDHRRLPAADFRDGHGHQGAAQSIRPGRLVDRFGCAVCRHPNLDLVNATWFLLE